MKNTLKTIGKFIQEDEDVKDITEEINEIVKKEVSLSSLKIERWKKLLSVFNELTIIQTNCC